MNLGKLKGLPILSINIEGEEQGHLQTVFSYKEAYEMIRKFKENDRKENRKDKYTLCLETENGYYYGYTIRKYRGRYIVKYKGRYIIEYKGRYIIK